MRISAQVEPSGAARKRLVSCPALQNPIEHLREKRDEGLLMENLAGKAAIPAMLLKDQQVEKG